MTEDSLSPWKTTVFFLTTALAGTALILALTLVPPPFTRSPPPIQTELYLSTRDSRYTSLDLASRNSEFIPLGEDTAPQIVTKSYAYLWISLTNPLDRDQTVFLANSNINYYTELLQPFPSGAATLFRQGDIVPVSEAPIRDVRAIFPLSIPAGETREFILEYHGPRSVVVAPGFYTPVSILQRMNFERAILGIICGGIILMILVNFAAGLLTRQTFPLAATLFNLAVFFFFLRQSRLLALLIDPLTYPEWLFPLSISFNLGAAALLIRILLNPFMKNIEQKILRGLTLGVALFAFVSLFHAPYTMADILNFLSFPLLLLTIAPLTRSIRKKSYPVFWTAISFLPWISLMIVDVVNSFRAVRELGFTRYRQGLGLGMYIFLFTVTTLFLLYRHHKSPAEKPAEEESQPSPPSTKPSRPLNPVIPERTAIEIQRSAETIFASIRLLQYHTGDPQTTAVTQVISSEAAALIQVSADQLPFSAAQPLSEASQTGIPVPTGRDLSRTFTPQGSPPRIWIFDRNQENLRKTTLLLQSEGFAVIPAESRYAILQGAEERSIDTLILDPFSLGEEALSLCRILRSDHNRLSLPILMIGSSYSSYLIRQGYAAGANDFLNYPFFTDELTARVQSLVKLKQLVEHNQDLARSEKEKNTFLFFLTHNINTPLTILLNRVRELSRMDNLDNMDNLDVIAADLSSSSREINEIVQNVLVSFRLADGRQPIRLEEVRMEEVLHRVHQNLSSKADAKEQRLILRFPEELPSVQGDETSIRGIIYNLLDNAIKFSPHGGTVHLTLRRANGLILEVQDSGPGIPPEDRSRLFQRFEKLSPRPSAGEPSTGLGLYIAHELARMNHGSLTLADDGMKPSDGNGVEAGEERPGMRGACFILTLPLSRPENLPGGPSEGESE